VGSCFTLPFSSALTESPRTLRINNRHNWSAFLREVDTHKRIMLSFDQPRYFYRIGGWSPWL
jgi:hypothetical protein